MSVSWEARRGTQFSPRFKRKWVLCQQRGELRVLERGQPVQRHSTKQEPSIFGGELRDQSMAEGAKDIIKATEELRG